jgi:hypothetical protein
MPRHFLSPASSPRSANYLSFEDWTRTALSGSDPGRDIQFYALRINAA